MPKSAEQRRVPKVRIVAAKGRALQIRYTDPDTGREVRIGTGTHDLADAERQKGDIEAKLRLGIEAKPAARSSGPSMSWDAFREEYARLKSWRTETAREGMEYRLDIVEAVMKPRTLGELAKPSKLAELQARLLAGDSGNGPRSRHTVKSYMRHLIAALNWAHSPMGWLPDPVKFRVLDVDQKTNKGRALTLEEFERMLAACDAVCAHDAASWQFLLRGLWESGLRLSEALAMAWDDEQAIRPEWPRRGRPVLVIPAAMHKSRRDETIPILPSFAQLLAEVPEPQRAGFVFNPTPRRGERRLTTEQAGRIITSVGRKACVSVTGKGKPASAHDLRRSFGQRLADAGIPPRDLQVIMRHASVTTTEAYYLTTRVQDVADRLAAYLGTVNSLNSSDPSRENAATR
jgi:integrase